MTTMNTPSVRASVSQGGLDPYQGLARSTIRNPARPGQDELSADTERLLSDSFVCRPHSWHDRWP